VSKVPTRGPGPKVRSAGFAESFTPENAQRYVAGGLTFAELVGISPLEIAAYCDVARQLFTQARYYDALAIYEALSQANPDDAYVAASLGATLQMIGERDRARLAYSKAVELDPTLIQAWLNRAEMAAQDGDVEGARRDLQAALAAEATHAPDLRERARMLYDGLSAQ
jgi:tetratricopeptide (TPR) repeat protein